MSQQAVADHIGVTKTTVSELERGLLPLTLKYMRGIADCLAVTPADLLTETDNPEALSAWERQLLARYRAADEERRELFRRVAEAVLPPA